MTRKIDRFEAIVVAKHVDQPTLIEFEKESDTFLNGSMHCICCHF